MRRSIVSAKELYVILETRRLDWLNRRGRQGLAGVNKMRAGLPRSEAVELYLECCNDVAGRTDWATESWTLPLLEELERTLSRTIRRDEAEALRSALVRNVSLKLVAEWLRARCVRRVSWKAFTAESAMAESASGAEGVPRANPTPSRGQGSPRANPTPEQIADRAMVDAILKGQGGGWEELNRRYRGLARAIASKYGVHGLDADQVFNDALTIFHQNECRVLKLLNRKESFRWFFATIVARLARQHSKKAESSKHGGDDDPDVVAPGDGPEGEASKKEIWSLAQRTVRSVELQVLRLLAQGFSAKEVAERLGLTESNVYVLKFRAIRKLKDALRGGRESE